MYLDSPNENVPRESWSDQLRLFYRVGPNYFNRYYPSKAEREVRYLCFWMLMERIGMVSKLVVGMCERYLQL